jgi:membrane glycosyltransferase
VGLMALASWLVGIYIAKIVIAEFVGRSLLRNTGDVQPATALVLLVGLIPIFVAINLPFIGGLIHFFLVVLGLGVFAIRTYQMPPWRSAQAA